MAKQLRKSLFERLKVGLDEAVAHSAGVLNLKSVDFPEEPPEIDAEAVAALREQTAMSQAVFAKLLNVSTKTVQSWEQGVRIPSMASRRLIQVFSQRPDVLCEIVGLPAVTLSGVTMVRLGNGRRKMVVRPMKASQKKSRPI